MCTRRASEPASPRESLASWVRCACSPAIVYGVHRQQQQTTGAAAARDQLGEDELRWEEREGVREGEGARERERERKGRERKSGEQ